MTLQKCQFPLLTKAILFELTYHSASGPVTPELVVQLAAESEIVLPIKHEAEWATVLMELDDSARDILTMGDYFPEVDLKKYLRTEVEIPNDNFGGGWALKVCFSVPDLLF